MSQGNDNTDHLDLTDNYSQSLLSVSPPNMFCLTGNTYFPEAYRNLHQIDHITATKQAVL